MRIYDRFVDANGRTTLNQAEYQEFRKKMAEKKKQENKVKVSKKNKQNKI